MNKTFKMLVAAAAFATALMTGCTTSSGGSQAPVVQPAGAQGGVAFVQVEQVARPAIGEGLLVTNTFLQVYNAVSPAFINAALTNPGGPEAAAAAPILAEAGATLAAFLTQSNGTGPFAGVPGGPSVGFFVGIFLPDVMRIDTTQNFPPGTSSYAGALNANFVLIGGRKLTDDVIDITTTALTNNAAVIDNVPYSRPGGNTNPAIGHQLLNGQVGTAASPTTFPHLAPAN